MGRADGKTIKLGGVFEPTVDDLIGIYSRSVVGKSVGEVVICIGLQKGSVCGKRGVLAVYPEGRGDAEVSVLLDRGNVGGEVLIELRLSQLFAEKTDAIGL